MSNQNNTEHSSPSVTATDQLKGMIAEVKNVHNISKVWFIPLVAVIIGSWMVYQTWSNQGPLITINFENAEGVEIGNTKIKLRDITIGKVTNLKLNDDFDGVQVTARLDHNTDRLLKIDSEFWVVKPRIGRGGVSGLSTLLSGVYIELFPGIHKDTKSDFVGLETPPVTPLGTAGLRITLDSDTNSSLDIGDPVIFRDIRVGRIEYVYFNVDERVVYYDTFIESPYDKLVTANTRFWKINGFELELSADGLQFQTGTFESFMGGGVTFDVPENLPKGEPITERAFFTIHATKKDVLLKQFKNAQEFVLLFSQSIRGLSPGASVEYKGVRIGSVLRTDIDYSEMRNFLDKKTLIPVLIQIEPARLGLEDSSDGLAQVRIAVTEMIASGLHGFISSGNLLTGSKYIELQYVANADSNEQYYSGFQVVPSAASELEKLLEKINNVLSTIDQLALDKLVDNAGNAMANMDIAMVNFNKASIQVDRVLDRPESEYLIATVNQALLNIGKFTHDFSEGSKTHQDIQNLLSAMEGMIKELTPVLSQLNHQPNSLIFGGKRELEVEPKGNKK